MARSSSSLATIAVLAVALTCLVPAFIAPQPPRQTEAELRMIAAVSAGLAPLAVEQPATAYDSVVAMIQSWLVGGTLLVLIFGAALIAATANPLTKRREAVASSVKK